MEKIKTVEQMGLERRRVLLRLIAFAVFLVFLWLVFSAAPVYADTDPKSVIPPEEPGGKIEGWVYNRKTGSPISGLNVYIHWDAGGYIGSAGPRKTNSVGRFAFGDSDIPGGFGIQPNKGYYICVNGWGYKFAGGWTGDLGSQCENYNWCQWRGYEVTDSACYACKEISLEPSTVVRVPYAALFSNTKYATLKYIYTEGHTFSHRVQFSIGLVAGFSIGYLTSDTQQCTVTFVANSLEATYMSKRYYAASYWDESPDYPTAGIQKSGILGVVPSAPWDKLRTTEYLAYSQVPYIEHQIDPGGPFTVEYTETGEVTWSKGYVPFAISYKHFGTSINIDDTASTFGTNTVSYTIDRSSDPPGSPTYTFAVYTKGFPLSINGNNKGGLELHVWNKSGAG